MSSFPTCFSILILSFLAIFTNSYPDTTKTYYIDVPIDNFNPYTKKYESVTTKTTYQMKYLLDDTWYDKTQGFIFLYTGNEAPVEAYANNAGYLYNVAQQYKALLVFSEHRFFGDSWPLGKNFTWDLLHMQLLTPEQAMADYAKLIVFLQKQYQNEKVIVTGGSYGAMLSAWMRIKYPHLILGALACSAPLIQLEGAYRKPSGGMDVVSNDYARYDTCAQTIKDGFNRILSDEFTIDEMKKTFNTCDDWEVTQKWDFVQ